MKRETLQCLMIKDWTIRGGNDLQKGIMLMRSLKGNSGGKLQ